MRAHLHIGSLVLAVMFFAACATTHAYKFRELDYQSEFVSRYGRWRWDLPTLDKQQLTAPHMSACQADLKRSYDSFPFELDEIYQHPTQRVWFAVFQSHAISDLRVIYIFDTQQKRFIGKITRSLA